MALRVRVVVPEVVPIILVCSAAARTVVHGRASSDDLASVLLGVEREADLVLRVNGRDEVCVHRLLPVLMTRRRMASIGCVVDGWTEGQETERHETASTTRECWLCGLT